MAARSRLEDVKRIDERSKDCLSGYIRQIQKLFPTDNVYYTIPTLVIHWILLYYYVWEQFDPNNCGEGYVLSDDNKILTLKAEYGRLAYLTTIVESGVHEWKFKILQVNCSHYFMSIGIFKVKVGDYIDRVIILFLEWLWMDY